MAKIKVEICVGTTCHILGASRLQHLEDFLPEDLKDKVDITGSHCLNACKNDNFGSAPFVRIDGVIMGNASIDRIIAKLYELI
jgi:NADH:ubiquinone oxidoreductase subunit E